MRSGIEMGAWYAFWGSIENFGRETAARSVLGCKLRLSQDPKDRDAYEDMIQGRFGPTEAQDRLRALGMTVPDGKPEHARMDR
jgi:hypothetical protein